MPHPPADLDLFGTAITHISQKFNPLSLDRLSRNLREALDARPRVPLETMREFQGAGLYALYYKGGLPLYTGLKDSDVPVYIGKAEAGNSSYGDPSDETKPKLYQRIVEKHKASIVEASAAERGGNLKVADFEVRYLLLDDVWIVLGERALLRAYAPVLWNTLMPGFGANPAGTARKNARSIWDTIHPGRSRVTGTTCNRRFTRSEMRERIRLGIDISLMEPGRDRDITLNALRARRANMIWSPPAKRSKDQRFRVHRSEAFLEENAAIGRVLRENEWFATDTAADLLPDPEEAAENNVLAADELAE
ncbi:hypothetical protein Psi02_15210 [Planotetraspora silvatica]|uniref:Eco29kI family restriction endonuclease n=1 Tax=Planotetraspora silvatica TaxID=234614 RepID=A0A8J3XKB6_9ACTN|nr:Eco29kI family restriction endonuclease [Planotetraspora silvatica]GII45097.1 hypothetical protein Psi02_15210 [Planotetraspora silvatica]